jgi:hypothetical protein
MKNRRSWPVAALFLFFAVLPAQAQSLADYDYSNLSFRGIGVDYGFIWPNKVEATPAFSARIDLGYLGPGVRITPVVSYWNSTFRNREIERFAEQLNRLEGVAIDPEVLGTIDWTDISIGIDAHLVWTTPFRLFTYVGGGLAAHVLNGKGSAVQGTFVEDLLDTTTAGVAAMAGLEYQALPYLRLYGEGRYTLLSDVRYPGARVGAALMLPQRTAAAAQGTQGGR